MENECVDSMKNEREREREKEARIERRGTILIIEISLHIDIDFRWKVKLNEMKNKHSKSIEHLQRNLFSKVESEGCYSIELWMYSIKKNVLIDRHCQKKNERERTGSFFFFILSQRNLLRIKCPFIYWYVI